jgi:hypothetical protein
MFSLLLDFTFYLFLWRPNVRRVLLYPLTWPLFSRAILMGAPKIFATGNNNFADSKNVFLHRIVR